jgi:hypothetical protein
VEFDDTNGESHSEMTDSCLRDCAEQLLGQDVRFAYQMAMLLADECQSNPDCGKSQRVALIQQAILRESSMPRGYLHYRFGKPGHPLELVFPPSRRPAARNDDRYLVSGELGPEWLEQSGISGDEADEFVVAQ